MALSSLPCAASRRLGRFEEHRESFIVKDATGQALAYFYFEDETRSALGRPQGLPLDGEPRLPKWKGERSG
jgi:hypothetical protein